MTVIISTRPVLARGRHAQPCCRPAREQTEAGQTALEYALLVAVVCVTLCGLLVGFGTDLMDDTVDEVQAFFSDPG